MFLQTRINAFLQLGDLLNNAYSSLPDELCQAAYSQNAWFTKRSIRTAIFGISKFLSKESIDKWLSSYELGQVDSKRIGVIAAGNIPLVGFHDALSVLISGHDLWLKPSSDDHILMTWALQHLIKINVEFDSKIRIVERLNDADAYIATGSDNSSRYFNYYFKHKPNIIRANRTSVAILTGKECESELQSLGRDIFEYYGLGCRNVSKIYVPNGYDFDMLLNSLKLYEWVGNHHKYRNNYDYNKSIYLVNKEPHLDNGFLLLRESEKLVSPISVLFYQSYSDANELQQLLDVSAHKIQCIIGEKYVSFGMAQSPEVTDYADGVDTLKFLSSLS